MTSCSCAPLPCSLQLTHNIAFFRTTLSPAAVSKPQTRTCTHPQARIDSPPSPPHSHHLRPWHTCPRAGGCAQRVSALDIKFHSVRGACANNLRIISPNHPPPFIFLSILPSLSSSRRCATKEDATHTHEPVKSPFICFHLSHVLAAMSSHVSSALPYAMLHSINKKEAKVKIE